MGVKNLWDILESCKQTLPLHHLQNKRLCVDLSCWIVQLHTASRSLACAREKLYLRNLFHRLRTLIALNCSLIFVTDGSIPALKQATYRRRLGSSSEVAQEDTATAVPSLHRNKGSEFSCMIKEAKSLGNALGIPCLDGLEEAEAQCALLNFSNMCDGCFSADSDIFLFGARTVYRDIFLGDGGHVVCYEMVDIERKLGFGRNSLISLALLLGCDYSHGLHGFGPENACQIVKSLGEAHILHQIVSAGFKFEKKTKRTKQKGKAINCNENTQLVQDNTQSIIIENKEDPGTNSQFIAVIDAYLKPKCHSVDSEVVTRVCTQHPFQRSQLQQTCAQFFDWESEKTDQYILPKIAERNLRKFANLRAISSQSGIQTSLEMMPASCPVTAIMKQRKVQGRDFFEVSWQGIDGLKTSVVPADLMQSACPERIAEYIENKAQGKKEKRKPRPRKLAKVAVHEVDVQLQGLMLSIETESNTTNPTMCSRSFLKDSAESEVIDLLSPSPPIRARKVTKNKVDINNHINTIVIDINNYEEDISEECENNAQDHGVCEAVVCRDSTAPSKHQLNNKKYCNVTMVDMSNNEEDMLEKDEKTAPKTCICEAVTIRDSSASPTQVIDVLDSDIDESPEHQRRARELRMFINSIKEDLY